MFCISGFSSSGFDAVSETGSVSLTIGQVFYHQWTHNTGKVNEGMQQPYEIFVVGVADNSIPSISLFPNPAQDFVLLKVENEGTDFSYSLFSIEGKILEDQKIDREEMTVPLQYYSHNLFLLIIYKDNKIVKTYKIIKP
ncbi:MAG: T9SS type A sorting domain-containing protein [Saprospiraceae bacterium]|nr:T9SS type A sorting domain-containing protein [Saprospiraceae bacterium]